MSKTSKEITNFFAESSLFFVNIENELKQVIFVQIESNQEISNAQLILSGNREKIVKKIEKIKKGKMCEEVYVPEVEEETCYRVTLQWGNNKVEDLVTVKPEKHWVIHIIHHSHLDIGYTDPQIEVLNHHLNYLDQVLELCDLRKDDPDTNFKWVIEVTWPLKYWLESRPSRQINKMVQRIKEGRIEVCAAYMNMHTEAYDIDELARTFETAQKLRDKYNIEIDTAMQSDVPGHTKGFLMCLTNMGIKYLSVAHNYAGRSIPHLLPGEKLQRPFYWELDKGERVLVWYTDTPHGVYMEGNLLGFSQSYEETFKKLPLLLQEMKKENYEFNDVHIRVQGRYWDNAGPSIIPSQVAKIWNNKWAYPKLLTSTNSQFFKAIESGSDVEIPVFNGDWTDWWSDGIASNAYAMGINRETHKLLRTAETFHSILDIKSSENHYPKETLNSAYEKMALFDEHTWGAWNPWENSLRHNTSGEIQWNIKKSFAQDAYNQTLFEYRKALNLLVNLLDVKYDKKTSTIIVYNPSSFVRTDVVSVFIPFGNVDVRKPFSLVNENDEELAYSLKLRMGEVPEPLGAIVTFTAKNIPPFGQACYQLITTKEERNFNHISVNDEEKINLENSFYKINFDPETGGIISIIDKEIGEELINTNAAFQFNEYIYDQFTTAPRFNHLSGRIEGNAQNLLGQRSSASLAKQTLRKDELLFEYNKSNPINLAKINLIEKNQVYQKMLITLHSPGCEWIEQEIILFNELKRIDIVNRIKKIETEVKEAVYFSYPFNVENGRIRYEITGGHISLDDKFVPGSCHYMKAIQHWLAISNSKYTILWGTMEAPLIQLKNIYIPYSPFEKTLEVDEPHTIYSYALNNIWDTNFPNKQGGEIEFHYSITSHLGNFNPLISSKFGEEIQSQLKGITVPYQVDKKSFSFISINTENIKILAIRKLENNYYQVRLQEIGGIDTDVVLNMPNIKIEKAFISNIANGNLIKIESEEDKIHFRINKHEIKTIIFSV